MQFRLRRRFVPWLVAHSFEFWYYYFGAIASLYLLHHFQSEIPRMAKELGDLAVAGRLNEIKITDFLFLTVFILIFRTLSRLLFFYPARVQQKNLRLELISQIETASPETYKDFNDGQLYQTINNDLNRIRGFVGFALLQVGNIIIASTIFIPKIREFNSDFLIAFLPMVICIVLFTTIVYFIQPYMVKGMELAGEVQNFMIESYDAKKTIQNFHSEKSFIKLFDFHSNEEMKYFFRFTAGRNIAFPLVKIGVGASLIWAAFIVKDNNLSGTALIFFSGFLFLILEPLMLMSWIGVVTSQGFASWQRIKNVLKSVKTPFERKMTPTNEPLQFKLDFWKKRLDIGIQSGKWNVVVGDTGVGKTYFLENLSQYFYDHKVSYSFIQQEPYLYNDTIINNIFLGLAKTDRLVEKVKNYIKVFDLDVLADSIDSVLNLEVGENGKKISGGQAKRVCLIRSLISEVDFIIWDDPFSSVDLILESQILKKLKSDPDLENKTFILSSHRLSTVKSCDFIIYFEKEFEQAVQLDLDSAFKEGSIVGDYFKKQMV